MELVRTRKGTGEGVEWEEECGGVGGTFESQLSDSDLASHGSVGIERAIEFSPSSSMRYTHRILTRQTRC